MPVGRAAAQVTTILPLPSSSGIDVSQEGVSSTRRHCRRARVGTAEGMRDSSPDRFASLFASGNSCRAVLDLCNATPGGLIACPFTDSRRSLGPAKSTVFVGLLLAPFCRWANGVIFSSRAEFNLKTKRESNKWIV